MRAVGLQTRLEARAGDTDAPRNVFLQSPAGKTGDSSRPKRVVAVDICRRHKAWLWSIFCRSRLSRPVGRNSLNGSELTLALRGRYLSPAGRGACW
jgi:hypothetical protein